MSDVTRRPQSGENPVDDNLIGDAPARTTAGTTAGTTAERDRQAAETAGRRSAPVAPAAPESPGARADHGVGRPRQEDGIGAETGGRTPATTPGVGTETGGRTAAAPATGDHATENSGVGALLPHDESDKLGQRLHHAVAGFVDAPRASVEEADRILEEIAARFADAVKHRRETLRTSWEDTGEDHRATSTDTEQLRLALRDYRELADRLMRI